MLYIDEEKGVACSDQPLGSLEEEKDQARAESLGLTFSEEPREALGIGPEFE